MLHVRVDPNRIGQSRNKTFAGACAYVCMIFIITFPCVISDTLGWVTFQLFYFLVFAPYSGSFFALIRMV